jgi:hypothetical protein
VYVFRILLFASIPVAVLILFVKINECRENKHERSRCTMEAVVTEGKRYSHPGLSPRVSARSSRIRRIEKKEAGIESGFLLFHIVI